MTDGLVDKYIAYTALCIQIQMQIFIVTHAAYKTSKSLKTSKQHTLDKATTQTEGLSLLVVTGWYLVSGNDLRRN